MKGAKLFVYSAGGILLLAALDRFLVAAGPAQMLRLPDPLLGIPRCYAVLAVGTLELAVALICLFGKRLGWQLGWLAWLGTNFVVIWIYSLVMHYQIRGSSVGSLTDPLRIYQGATGYVLEFIPFCLVLGSYASAVWFLADSKMARLAEARERDATAGLLKMFCPSCGGHVKFAAQNAGQQIPCPHCRRAMILRRPENLKMSCFFCKGHIEFPAHALGQKLKCPHCKMDITLKEAT